MKRRREDAEGEIALLEVLALVVVKLNEDSEELEIDLFAVFCGEWAAACRAYSRSEREEGTALPTATPTEKSME